MKRTYAAHYQVDSRLYLILVRRILWTWFVLHLFAFDGHKQCYYPEQLFPGSTAFFSGCYMLHVK